MTRPFPWGMLTAEDREIATSVLGYSRLPDLVIAPDGSPYLYRWHLTDHEAMKDLGQVYFHIQVKSDPERPLHDHPWDNTSVILSGGYNEIWNPTPWLYQTDHDIEDHATTRELRKGRMLFRTASEAHRLILPKDFGYTMTLFSVGPTQRDWGFWTDQGWVKHDILTALTPDGRSIFRDGVHA